MKDKAHINRVRSELKEAGMTAYGFMKLESDHIPNIIHPEEHIKGVVYGRLSSTLDSIMLVATDFRLLVVDCKPFYKNFDEVTYDVVAGVKKTIIGPFAGVTLHTRVQDYTLRFVNIKCANIFVEYIETHIEQLARGETPKVDLKPSDTIEEELPELPTLKDDDISVKKLPSNLIRLDSNTAVLSTISKENIVHGSVVHYIVDKDENFYFMTRTETKKAQNIAHNKQVALTINRSSSLVALEVNGIAELVDNESTAETVIEYISAPKMYAEGKRFPPITKLDKGILIVFKITPTSTNLLDYSKSSW